MGLHSGVRGGVRVEPARFGSGVCFVVGDMDIPATLAHAVPVPGATTLQVGGVVVHTPEHLLSALRGAGLSDVRVTVDGPELPALDGAARSWMERLLAAGRVQGPTWGLRAVAAGCYAGHGGEVEVRPLGVGEDPTVTVEVDFPDGPHGTACWDGTVEGFARDVAWARTFVMEDQVDALRAAGRGVGASEVNTLVVPRRRAGSSSDAVAREAVAHKLLDAIGDLALVEPLAAHVVVRRGSHRVHVEGLRAVLGV